MKLFFEFAWRAAILAMPWQTRWLRDAAVAGWPWEQGRASFYISWFFILATILSGLALFFSRHTKSARSGIFGVRRYWLVFFLIIPTIIAGVLYPEARIAMAQWWIQILLLGAFVYALRVNDVTRENFTTWFVLSIVPHALLGVWQFASQEVIGHSWFGMSAQNPQIPGVSVIEVDGIRHLRAYGGFPHPNIFGGWTAVGIISAMAFALRARSVRHALAWTLCSSLFFAVLILTFARSAWLAVCGAFVIATSIFLFNKLRAHTKNARSGTFRVWDFFGGEMAANWVKAKWWIVVAPLVVALCVIASQSDLIRTRLGGGTRLETKSIDTRVGSLRSGFDLLRAHPFFGTGPNAELAALERSFGGVHAPAPLEPPHNAFLLALVNFGVLGFAVFIWLAWSILVALRQAQGLFHFSALSTQHFALSTALITLALFDHYLWSAWSGQALLASAILLMVLPE